MDFDQVLKDPLHPNGVNAGYDNGDGVPAIAHIIWLPELVGTA